MKYKLTLKFIQIYRIRCVRILIIKKCAERSQCNLICRVIEGKCIQWMCYDIPTPHDKKARRQCISLLTGSVASHTYI